MRSSLALVLLASASGASSLSLPTAAPIIVLGPGSLDMRLLTAKLAARSGFKTALFAGAGAQQIWLEQMYGVEDPSAKVVDDRPELVCDIEAREAALQSAEGLALISDGVAMPEAAMASVLEAAPLLKRVVLLSKMGVTRASTGPLGLGKGAVDQLEAEQRLSAACAAAAIGEGCGIRALSRRYLVAGRVAQSRPRWESDSRSHAGGSTLALPSNQRGAGREEAAP